MNNFLEKAFSIAKKEAEKIRFGSVEVKVMKDGEFADVIINERIRVYREKPPTTERNKHIRLDKET